LRAIKDEPAAATYLALIRFAEAQASTFSLTWRQQLQFDAVAKQVEEALRPSLVRHRVTDTWPGTQLLGHAAVVRFYSLSPAAQLVLDDATRLYAWRAPVRPEDLAFYTPAGRWWLASIAHEQQSFIDPDGVDVSGLLAAVPGLHLGDWVTVSNHQVIHLWSDAWLLQSIALATETGPATLAQIFAAADAVNHALPTSDELHGGFVRLTAAGFIAETEDRFTITQLVPFAILSSIRSSGWESGRRIASKFLQAEEWTRSRNVRDPRNDVVYEGLTDQRIGEADREYRRQVRSWRRRE
jgi:hypothetical protein